MNVFHSSPRGYEENTFRGLNHISKKWLHKCDHVCRQFHQAKLSIVLKIEVRRKTI